jgi:hypothetical protein
MLKEGQRMMVFEEVTGRKTEDETGYWRKQHNEEPNNSHSLPDKVKR